VPEYYELVINREMTQHWISVVKKCQDVVIYDFDGPRDEDGSPVCLEVDVDLLREKINDGTYPFGHGYIIAGILLGIKPEMYV